MDLAILEKINSKTPKSGAIKIQKVEIIRKLDLELKKEIKGEARVVYILSLIRKILEIKNQKDKFKLLNFYCNWSLHVSLSVKRTKQVITDMLDQDIDCSKRASDIARKLNSNHADFFKLNDIKKELVKFIADNDLSPALTNKRQQWVEFVSMLLQIIQDCPVICIESSKKIKTMKLQRNKKNEYYYKFSLHSCSSKPIIKLKFKQ